MIDFSGSNSRIDCNLKCELCSNIFNCIKYWKAMKKSPTTKFSRELTHRHRKRTMSHRDFGKLLKISPSTQKLLNEVFFRGLRIFMRVKKNRFIFFSSKAKTRLDFIKDCNDFIAHKNYSIRAYVIRKAIKCRQKQKS